MEKMTLLALDLETHMIKDHKPPKPVCISWAFDKKLEGIPQSGVVSNQTTKGNDGVFKFAKLAFELAITKDVKLVFHNAVFDLSVLFIFYEDLRDTIIELLEQDKIHDTLIREKLYLLSTVGRVESKKGALSLAGLAKKYHALDMSHLKTADAWRCRYAELDGLPVEQWPSAAYDYPILDAVTTLRVYEAQEAIRQPTGYGSMNTEGLQISASLFLKLTEIEGFKLDTDKINELKENLNDQLKPHYDLLLKHGFAKVVKDKVVKQDKKLKEHIVKKFPHVYCDESFWTEHTEKDRCRNLRIDEETLFRLSGDEIVDARAKCNLLEKYLSTYVGAFEKCKGYQHWSYDVLKETGRTSGLIQLIPKDGGFRECFYDSDFYIIDIDYSALELVCVAQAMLTVFGESRLADVLNAGDTPADIHAVMGAYLWASDTGTDPNVDEFIKLKETNPKIFKEYRTRGKPVGLGFFGGLGCDTMISVAKSQGVNMTLEEAKRAKEAHAMLFPEIIKYLRGKDAYIHKLEVSPLQYAYEVNGRFRNN